MASIEIIQETPWTLVEVKEALKGVKGREKEGREKELPVRLNKTQDYLQQYAKMEGKRVKEMKERLGKLEIMRLRDRHMVKIIDIMPRDLDGLRLIFSGENVTLKQEDLQKILDTLHGK